MTAGAKLGRLNAKLGRTRIMDVVDAMTICTNGNIRIVFFEQCRPMYAVLVIIKDLGMALPADLRNVTARFVRWSNVVGAVTIGTNGSIQIAGFGDLSVHAILGFCVILRMALLAGEVINAGKFAPGLVFNLRVRVSLDVRMAGLAFYAQRTVDRITELFG